MAAYFSYSDTSVCFSLPFLFMNDLEYNVDGSLLFIYEVEQMCINVRQMLQSWLKIRWKQALDERQHPMDRRQQGLLSSFHGMLWRNGWYGRFFSTSACVGMRSFAWDGVLRVFMVLHGVNKCNIAVRPIRELVGVRMVRWQVEWTEVCVMPCHNFDSLSVTWLICRLFVWMDCTWARNSKSLCAFLFISACLHYLCIG